MVKDRESLNIYSKVARVYLHIWSWGFWGLCKWWWCTHISPESPLHCIWHLPSGHGQW